MSLLLTRTGAASTACAGAPDIGPDAAAPQYTTTATVRDLMLALIDSSADTVWNSVGTIATQETAVELAPKADEEWDLVRRGALRLVEASNLLQVPVRRVMEREKSENPGVELEGLEIEALIQTDPAAWNARALALHDASAKALKVIDARDANALLEVGPQIEHACEGCYHTTAIRTSRCRPRIRRGVAGGEHP